MLKVTFEKPKIFGIAGQAKNVLEQKEKSRKKVTPKPWTYKDRLFVLGVLLGTLILGAYFWYKGQRTLPSFDFAKPGSEWYLDFGGFSFQRTIDLD
ncbi:MAG: hypothetical protein HYU80_00165 [Candidatus Blackburnbacteria bacterium]|nr:hypothetical protein [Candidatus Blackburnbacteria bacterium]